MVNEHYERTIGNKTRFAYNQNKICLQSKRMESLGHLMEVKVAFLALTNLDNDKSLLQFYFCF